MTGDSPEAERAFLRAALAQAAQGNPSPNPHVGAIVVRDGVIVGQGHHPKAGHEHAEVMALRGAGELALGATLYVTLEPCNHQGRTPPCTDAIIHAGIAKVVIGVRDPDPRVSGGGLDRLRAASIGVEQVQDAQLLQACSKLIAPFAKHAKTGLPFVRLKTAQSLDGRIAAVGGQSRWITGPASRRAVHVSRAAADAVLVGRSTVASDDPALTARDAPLPIGKPQPVRVVVDGVAVVSRASQLVQSAREIPTWIVVRDDLDPAQYADLIAAGVRIVFATGQPGAAGARHVALRSALQALGSAGIVDLLIEGGGSLAGALVEEDLVDELQLYVAPIVLGAEGTASFLGPRPTSPDSASRYVLGEVDRFDNDVRLIYQRG